MPSLGQFPSFFLLVFPFSIFLLNILFQLFFTFVPFNFVDLQFHGSLHFATYNAQRTAHGVLSHLEGVLIFTYCTKTYGTRTRIDRADAHLTRVQLHATRALQRRPFPFPLDAYQPRPDLYLVCARLSHRVSLLSLSGRFHSLYTLGTRVTFCNACRVETTLWEAKRKGG